MLDVKSVGSKGLKYYANWTIADILQNQVQNCQLVGNCHENKAYTFDTLQEIQNVYYVAVCGRGEGKIS